MRNSKTEFFFDLYSKNWDLVKKSPAFKGVPDEEDLFICPACFSRCFRRGILEFDELALEHVPPEKLGGKVKTLTCRKCNNWAGSELESHLLRKLEFIDFLSRTPGASQEITYSVNGSARIDATIDIPKDDAETWRILGDLRRSNPKSLDIARSSFKLPPSEITINVQFRPYKQNRPEAALLRIAYLWAFSAFGYGFLINPHLSLIRDQIYNPTKMYLPAWGILTSGDFSDQYLGVNIVTEPEHLQSFLVVFDLFTHLGTTIRHGVFLPRAISSGLGIYDCLLQHEGKIISFNYRPARQVQINHEPFASHYLWDETV